MSSARFGGKKAVVVGGSMAGLLAARALTNHFDQVILLERDSLPDGPTPHKGVPQGRQAHGLLGKGESILAKYFPALRQDLLDRGAVVLDNARDVRWLQGGAWKARFDSGVELLFCSRPLLEWRVRTHLLQVPNLTLQDGVGVKAFLWNEGRSRVTGLLTDQGELDADFVVDATGRGSRTADWLAEVGLGQVPVSTVRCDVGYSNRLYKAPKEWPWKFLLQLSSAPVTRMGWIGPAEGGLWQATLVGYHGDHPPTDETGFEEYARSLPVPDFYEAIRAAEPVSEIVPHRAPVSLRRHYDRMERFPDGLAVTGDAACCFNPVYGQGMTTAALGAEALDAALAEQAAKRPGDVTGLSKAFQKKSAAATAGAWMTVATEDFRYKQTTGDKPSGLGFMHWYFGRLHQLMATDQELTRLFIEVVQMHRPGTDLLKPGLLWKAMRG
jgi:2-polyprenyl-6-methoxyphenol hydroxylase-like FAD-dependent oxidoreductase